MFIIGRHINGITLNPLEYVLDSNGEKYGWGRVLDYIGVAWEDYPNGGQLTLNI